PAPLPTHNALHTPSHPQQPAGPTARSKTNARSNRTLPPQHPQTTDVLASAESGSNRHAAPRVHHETCARFLLTAPAPASIQTPLTHQTTTAFRHKHPATASPRSLSPAPGDRTRVPSMPSCTPQTHRPPAAPIAPPRATHS